MLFQITIIVENVFRSEQVEVFVRNTICALENV